MGTFEGTATLRGVFGGGQDLWVTSHCGTAAYNRAPGQRQLLTCSHPLYVTVILPGREQCTALCLVVSFGEWVSNKMYSIMILIWKNGDSSQSVTIAVGGMDNGLKLAVCPCQDNEPTAVAARLYRVAFHDLLMDGGDSPL